MEPSRFPDQRPASGVSEMPGAEAARREESPGRTDADLAIARIVADAGAGADAVEEALRTLCVAFGWTFAALWIFDRAAGVLRCTALWGEGALRAGGFAAATRRVALPPGIGLPGRVWVAARPCWLDDVTTDPGFARAGEAGHEGLHTAIAFPIHAGGEPVGVLELFGARIAPPDERVLATMTTVGALIGQQIRIVQAQEALRESESLRAAIVEGADDAIFSEGTDGIITSWNLAAERLFGYRAAEAIGHPTRMLVPPEQTDEPTRRIAAVQRGGRVAQFETVALRKDGSRVDVCLGVSPIRGLGDVRGASIIARDITDRRRAEQALRHSEERYRSLVQASTSVVWSADAGGATFAASPSWETYTGQRYPGGLGTSWLDMIHADDRTRLRDRWREVRAEARPLEVEIRVWNAADERYRRCFGRGVPLLDAGGRVREWVGTLTDVDDRRRAEQGARFLAEATALLAGSLDYERTLAEVARLTVPALADLCTVHVVEDGDVRRIPAAHLDPAREVALTEHHRRARRPVCDAGEVIRTGRSLLLTGPCAACAEAGACRTPPSLDGGARLCVPMHVRGRTVGAICFILLEGSERRYGTEEVALCEELARRAAIAIDNARLYRLAQRAAEAREEFLVIASHELRTPLVPLKLAVQSLLKQSRAGSAPAPAQAERLLGSVERCTDRLGVLVEELLDIARLSAERIALTPEPVDLAGVVADVLSRARDGLAEAGCAVRVDTAGPTTGRWDRPWLEKAVARLLANAAKYGRGRPVEIRVEGAADAVRVSVRDHGFGIPEGEQARIFERFERAVSTRHYGGFGFGLWSVRRIAEAHGGSARVESRPGAGATFTIELPRRAAEA